MPISDGLRQLLNLDAEEAVDLGEGEQILHVTGRHVVDLLIREILPVLGLLCFGGLAVYRALGGTFLVTGTGEDIGLDLLNWLLILITSGLAVLWGFLLIDGKKSRQTRTIVLGVGALLLVILWFRYNGGRLFYRDPGAFGGQAGDPLNWILILLAGISTVFMLFTFYDWLNDELILTNQRVIYDNDQVIIPKLLEQRVQEQIFLEDIQDVSAKTKTYLQHWLKFGTIEVKSARIGGTLRFVSAQQPMVMQKQIMEQVSRLRKERAQQDFESMIEGRVYNNKPQRPKEKIAIRQTRAMRAMSWAFLENPEINHDTRTVVWRPHWLFQLRALIGPFVLLVGGLLAVALASRSLDVDPVLITLATILVIVVFALWTVWEIIDYRNDQYILTPTNVIDIEAKPFGPEDRRQASLGALNNISFTTTFVSNLLGYGDVILETAGSGGKFTFCRVPHPGDVVGLINDYYVDFKRGEKEKNLNDTLDLLRYYHAAQQRHNELNIQPPT